MRIRWMILAALMVAGLMVGLEALRPAHAGASGEGRHREMSPRQRGGMAA